VRAREITSSLRVFAAERAPAAVVLALAVSLCAGPWALAGEDGPALLRAVAVVFLVLTALRIVDDLRSIEHDRIASPERALPAGRIEARPLVVGAALLFAAAALVSVPRLTLGLGLLAAYYAAYYALVERIPIVLRPPLVNAVFLAIPLGVGVLSGGAGTPGAAVATGGQAVDGSGGAGAPALVALAAFYWLSAVGHDYAHEVHSADDAPSGLRTISQSLGPRVTAGVGLCCYVGGCVAGLLAARGALTPGRWPPLFVTSLAVLFGYVGFLLVRLIALPGRERARRLYVSGVVCFAVPSLLLGLDRLLRS
jgi:4-hydroxybenzoate polyprenyltransferase